MITYRETPLDVLLPRLPEIDVSEHGTVVYDWIDGQLKPVPETWRRPPWTAETSRQESWTRLLETPGIRAWGAFDDQGRLVGTAVYRPRLTAEMAQLVALFVSQDCRRRGIAARLTDEVVHQARQDGHTQLYVSATPSESAVGFYRAQGFAPTQEAHPELYTLEPDDIHMVKQL